LNTNGNPNLSVKLKTYSERYRQDYEHRKQETYARKVNNI